MSGWKTIESPSNRSIAVRALSSRREKTKQ
jgi:hypothetical protein